jgi:hypothetical protein
VYTEEFDGPAAMVERERQLKGLTRRRKLELIHSQNPEMIDYARRTARDPSLRQPALRMTERAKQTVTGWEFIRRTDNSGH